MTKLTCSLFLSYDSIADYVKPKQVLKDFIMQEQHESD